MERSISNAATESKPQTEENTGFKTEFEETEGFTEKELNEQNLPKEIKGWTQVDNRLFWQGRYLTSDAKWVYATIRSFMNNDTGKMFPSYDAILERSGMTKPRLAAAQRELEHFYWITKRKRFSKSTIYKLSFPARVRPDKSLVADQTVPTKAEAVAWAMRLREERKAKDAKRKTKHGWHEAREAIERKRAAEMEEEDSIPF